MDGRGRVWVWYVVLDGVGGLGMRVWMGEGGCGCKVRVRSISHYCLSPPPDAPVLTSSQLHCSTHHHLFHRLLWCRQPGLLHSKDDVCSKL